MTTNCLIHNPVVPGQMYFIHIHFVRQHRPAKKPNSAPHPSTNRLSSIPPSLSGTASDWGQKASRKLASDPVDQDGPRPTVYQSSRNLGKGTRFSVFNLLGPWFDYRKTGMTLRKQSMDEDIDSVGNPVNEENRKQRVPIMAANANFFLSQTKTWSRIWMRRTVSREHPLRLQMLIYS